MKRTKTSLLKSALALLLCVSMLIGSTFAWFTDKVTSKGNIIQSGNLDIEMYWTDDLNSGNWYNVEDDAHNTIFSYGKWEPGYTDVKYIKLVNKGNLAMNYKLTLTPQGSVGKLAEVINVFFANKAVDVQSREDLSKLGAIGLLNNVLNGGATANGTLLAKDQYSPLHPSGEVIMTIAMNMITTAGNEYQEEDSGEFTITALATQAAFEKDSFGSDYDSNAEYPTIITGGTVTTQVNAVDGKVPAGGVTMTGNGISAFVPGGIEMAAGADALTLSVTPMEHTTTDITVVNNEILIPVDVHISGIAAGNTTPIVIDLGEVLPKYMNMGNYHLYHVENGANSTMTLVGNEADLTEHNRFTYDPLTGAVKVAMASFSEVALVADTTKGWEGKFDYTWYDASKSELTIANADQLAAFGAIVGGMVKDIAQDSFAGKTVKLLSDINLGDYEGDNPEVIFYPIGYNSSDGKYEKTGNAVTTGFYNFCGTFDGNGHSVSNFYHNTWDMKGDNNYYDAKLQYYRDGMGLFGRVYGGTIKNLTVSNFSSDGEYTTTGVIAAYADGATFENIAITNCTPRVYNIGNGGIVGCVGWYAKDANLKTTFKNITVDNSNKISALWGSYDVACGGIVGQYYPTSGQTSANSPKNAGVHFENCHVSAVMDVYNDVCGNYQYYAYRYAGMMIGSIRENETIDGRVYPKMDGITANSCTVDYGTWNDYYYCELVANSLASYTHDHQFSRLEVISSLDEIKSDDTWTKVGNFLLISGDTKTCYHIVNKNGTLAQHNHDDAGEEIVEGKTVLKEDKQIVYLPFAQMFTGYSWGVTSVGVTAMNGIINITIGNQENSVEKFETKFTGDFLYRVGNGNAFPIGALFEAKGDAQIVDSGVWVTVEKFNKDMDVSGKFTANTTDWTKGTIKFEGTGIAKITIQDYNFCKPTVLYVEVVDATNYASSSISSLGSGNVALLCDTKLNQNGALALQNASLYGNGFTIDVTAGKITGESISSNYMLYMNNATIDNVQIIGAVYTNFDVISSNKWNNPVILAVGNSTIANSYIANCASPVRMAGNNLNIINSTLKGGFFANLDIRGGNTVLDNVTTINQANLNDKAADGSDIAGLGVVVFYEGPSSSTTITIKNNLTQYNYLANVTSKNSYANMLLKEIFESGKYEDFIYTDSSGMQWANTGIISLCEEVGSGNIITKNHANKNAYKETSLSYSNSLLDDTANGYLYSTNPKTICNSYKYVPTTQYEIVPKVSINHELNQVIKTDDSETSCSSDPLTDQENITFANGDSFEWNVNVLKSANKDITYTVWIDGTQYTDKVVFDTSGTHTVVFKYSDAINYRKDGKEIKQYTAEYETSMIIVVSEKAPTAKGAEITFPVLNSYGTTKVTVDGKTYIMPNLTGTKVPQYDADFDTSNRKYGSLKTDGRASVDIYYPIIKTAVQGSLTKNMVYPVFGNGNGTLVQIQDYADKGAGAALTPYNASTKTLPAGLSVVRGYTVQWSVKRENKTPVVGSGSMSYGNWVAGVDCMRYQTAAGTAIDCGDKGGYLSYYPNINISSNDREEQIQVVEYKYVDNKGDTYYYCVGYHIEERNDGYAFGEIVPEDSGGDDCVTGDSLVTLADGTQKRIDQITYQDELLVWDFFNGCYTITTASVIYNHGDGIHKVTNLRFSDGTIVKVIGEHEFFDAKANSFVYISEENVSNYIGHKFIKVDGDRYTTVTLENYFFTEEETGKYTILTAKYNNAIIEGMLSLTPDPTNKCEDFFRLYEVGEDMKYDQEKMQADIEKYGLFTYEDLAAYVTYEEFVAFNGEFYKILVGKGLITVEDIVMALATYAPNH